MMNKESSLLFFHSIFHILYLERIFEFSSIYWNSEFSGINILRVQNALN